jgi:integrase
MSENTVLGALYRMGFHGRATGHGFRSLASTTLNTARFPSDAIEVQLAHTESNSSRSAYNYADWIFERRFMMQAWADFLDAAHDLPKAQADLRKAAKNIPDE